ncbi:hypothetical protein HDU99_003478 [Rhizoclosmatium hyalinum]|nr:hypothetical protein HDU99_003478 [Rhizoclosmatium hyalinum]
MIFGWPKTPNAYVSVTDQYVFVFVCAFAYFAFFNACYSNPGIVNITNAEKVNKLFDHDYLIFSPKMCSTCLIDKPARSKHCSLCKVCVAKADHHCAWSGCFRKTVLYPFPYVFFITVNNCVGHNNYRYFLLFLVGTWILCFYMTYIVSCVLLNEIKIHNVARYLVIDPKTNQRRQITQTEVYLFIAQSQAVLTALGAFAFLAGLVVLGFMFYQLYLVASGRTANESFKWEDLAYDLKHGVVTEITKEVLEYNQNYGKSGSKKQNDGDATRNDASTANENVRRRKKTKDGERKEKEEQVSDVIPFTSLKQVRNIYDRGILGNLYEALFPFNLK